MKTSEENGKEYTSEEKKNFLKYERFYSKTSTDTSTVWPFNETGTTVYGHRACEEDDIVFFFFYTVQSKAIPDNGKLLKRGHDVSLTCTIPLTKRRDENVVKREKKKETTRIFLDTNWKIVSKLLPLTICCPDPHMGLHGIVPLYKIQVLLLNNNDQIKYTNNPCQKKKKIVVTMEDLSQKLRPFL